MHLTAAITTTLAALAAGHTDHNYEAEMAQRRDFLLHSRSNLDHCASKLAEGGLEKRAAHRRAGLAGNLAKRNGVRGICPPAQLVRSKVVLIRGSEKSGRASWRIPPFG